MPLLLALTPLPATPGPVVADGTIVIPHDTLIDLRTVSELSSQTNVRGDSVELEVAEPVTIGGNQLVPAGTRAMAQVIRAERKGSFGAPGNLAIELLYVMVNDRPYRLRGTFDTRGKSASTVAMTSAYFVAFASIITGKRAVVPAGTRVIGMFVRDAALPVTSQR